MAHSSSTDSPGAQAATGRSMVSCEACRESHSKCEPRGRIWTNSLESKCNRCQRFDLPCGPSVRGKRKSRLPATDVTLAYRESSINNTAHDSTVFDNLPAIGLLRIAELLMKYQRSVSGDQQYFLSTTPIYCGLPFHEVWKLVSRRMSVTLHYMWNKRSDPHGVVPPEYESMLRDLHQRCKILDLERMLSRHAPGAEGHESNDHYQMSRSVHIEHPSWQPLRCVRRFWWTSSATARPSGLTAENYCIGASEMNALLRETILHHHPNAQASGGGFCASVIAYLNHDFEIAAQLATEESAELAFDLFGRNIVQWAVEQRNFAFLGSLQSEHRPIFGITGVDIFGLSVSQIQTVRDSPEHLSFLSGCGIDVSASYSDFAEWNTFDHDMQPMEYHPYSPEATIRHLDRTESILTHGDPARL